MKIHEGAYYRTRDGDVVGPMRLRKDQSWYSCYHQWNEDGGIFSGGAKHGLDLISEVYVSDTSPGLTATTITNGLPHAMPETKTLRDEFAATALKAMLGHSDYVELSPAQMAVKAYRQADAMMEARKK
jgi:hypothetical protein